MNTQRFLYAGLGVFGFVAAIPVTYASTDSSVRIISTAHMFTVTKSGSAKSMSDFGMHIIDYVGKKRTSERYDIQPFALASTSYYAHRVEEHVYDGPHQNKSMPATYNAQDKHRMVISAGFRRGDM